MFMRSLAATLNLTLNIFPGSAGVGESAEPIKRFCLSGTKYSHLPIAGKCSASYEKGDYASAMREWKPRAEQENSYALNNLVKLKLVIQHHYFPTIPRLLLP